MVIQKLGYYLFLFFICSYKKVKKKMSSEFCGIRTHNLDVKELQLVLEKAFKTLELSGPINVKDKHFFK